MSNGLLRPPVHRSLVADHSERLSRSAFTLIELLVVITIIAILIGLLFPAFRGVQDQAKRTQTKNDLAQIIVAVNAFYTEYGRYPLSSSATAEQITYAGDNDQIFNVLRGSDMVQNPRAVPFINIPTVKDFSQPRGGIGGDGKYYDPFGMPYSLAIDSNYNNKIDNPYQNAGFSVIDIGVIAYSSGKNKTKDENAKSPDFDDVLSWQ